MLLSNCVIMWCVLHLFFIYRCPSPGVMRAILQHDMLKPTGASAASLAAAAAASSSPSHPKADAATVQRLFYCGPMFRYENPQRGRLRQFTQFGVELIGARAADTGAWQADVEVLLLGAHVLRDLGLFPRHTMLRINTLGDAESRAAYRAALVAFLEPLRAQVRLR
jgi:histidyl-tRNA synthetase